MGKMQVGGQEGSVVVQVSALGEVEELHCSWVRRLFLTTLLILFTWSRNLDSAKNWHKLASIHLAFHSLLVLVFCLSVQPSF